MFFSMIGFIVILAIGVWLTGGSLFLTYYAFQISGGVHNWNDRLSLGVMLLLGIVCLSVAWVYAPFSVVLL